MMRRLFIGCLSIVGLIALCLTAGIVVLVVWGIEEARQDFGHGGKSVPDKAVLILELNGSVAERGSGFALAGLTGKEAPTLRSITAALDRATSDPRVTGLFADLSGATLPLARAQELRDAVARFRAAGKHAFAFADSFDESSTNMQSYLLATGFEQVWMQPSGQLGITGLSLEQPFVADLLNSLGVAPRLDQRKEYKGGIDMFTRTSMSPELHDSLTALVTDLTDQIVKGIAAARKMSEDEVRALIDQAPIDAKDALSAKLIDAVGYRDEAEAKLGATRTTRIDLADYLDAVGSPNRSGTTIAVITGIGEITRGSSGPGLGGSESLSAQRIAEAFRQAVADPEVRAILFRIDSPGGSYVASDTLWRAVHRARDAGKPVVVSIGSLGASGGYFAAIAGDRIVAEPGTLTGSIGVFAGKFVLSGLWDKIGVTWSQIKSGAHAGQDSMNRDFTAEEWSHFEEELDRIYADFTGRVATDRKLPADRIDQVAGGRVWTGRQAASLGLVDVLGGFDTALGETKRLASLAPDAPVRLKNFPAPRSLYERVTNIMQQASTITGELADLGAGLQATRREQTLRMPYGSAP
jgi:protease-4